MIQDHTGQYGSKAIAQFGLGQVRAEPHRAMERERAFQKEVLY